MYSIPRLSRRAHRAGTSTLLASFAALSLLSGNVPNAAAQSAPYVTVDDIGNVNEGALASFPVTVHGAHNQFSIDYETRDGTAVAGKDYTSASSSVIIPNSTGDSTVFIDVQTLDDTIYEADEVFHLKLLKTSSVYNITKSVGDATIISNDPYPAITIKDARMTEGDPGATAPAARFEVSLSNPSSQDVTVDWTTQDLDGAPAEGKAVGAADSSSPGDYIKSTGTLWFPAEQNPTRIVEVDPLPDNTYEGNEKFFVQLSNAINANLVGNGKATGIVVDDDPQPRLDISTSAAGPEGNSSGLKSQIGVNVTLTNPSVSDVTFTYSTANGTARENDYATVTNAVATIPAGSTKKTVWFSPIGDDRVENDETFSVFVQSVTNAKLGNATSEVTIQNDDK
jgi:hypothetical protein